MPENICSNCIGNATASYKFQKVCNKSHFLLETYFSQFKETVIEETPSLDIKEVEEFSNLTTDLLDDSKTPLLYNENDLDLAENYIKESLIEEANNSNKKENESSLNPDQFFATDDDLALGTLNTDKKDVKKDEENSEKEGSEESDEEGIGNLKTYVKTLPTGEKVSRLFS